MIGGDSFDGMFTTVPKDFHLVPGIDISFIPETEVNFNLIGAAWWGLRWLNIRTKYPARNNNDSYAATFIRIESDQSMTCPNREIARYAVQNKVNVYRYEYAHLANNCSDFAI